MSQSYVQHGTKVVCTNMQGGAPMQLVVYRGVQTVVHEKPVLLNKEDRKISEPFVCKNASKFWGGLTTLCVGIAMGAMAAVLVTAVAAAVVATEVATAGLATPLLALLAVGGIALVGACGSAVTMNYKSHDCDYSLQSEWLNFHPTVKLNGDNALVHNSTLKCIKGGIVSIYLNDELAQEAATEISKNNNEEVNEHEKYKLLEGFVVGITGITATGIAVGSILTIVDYTGEESESQEKQAEATEKLYKHEKFEEEKKTLGQEEKDNLLSWKRERDLGAGMSGDVAYESGKALAKKEGMEGVKDAAKEYVKEASFKPSVGSPTGSGFKGSLAGFGWAVAGGLFNTWMEHISNKNESEKFEDTLQSAMDTRESDFKNSEGGINIVADKV